MKDDNNDDDGEVSAGSDAVSDDAFEAAASDFNKFDGFPFATQTQSSIRSKKFRITLRAKKRKSRADCKGSCKGGEWVGGAILGRAVAVAGNPALLK